MDQEPSPNIILIGFSFTGKSEVGRAVARRLGWRFVDTDEEIVARLGKPIPRIFAEDGEDHFRKVERNVLEETLEGEKVVMATGGGAVLDPQNRELMNQRGVVVLLEATPETIYQRLLEAEGARNPVVRPLLSGPDPLGRIQALKGFRQNYYTTLARWTVHTDCLTLGEVSDEVLRGWAYCQGHPGTRIGHQLSPAREEESPYCPWRDAACVVETATASYPIYVGWGILDELGRRMEEAGLSGRAIIVSDQNIFPLYGPKVKLALEEAGFWVEGLAIPPGEATKTLATAQEIYDWLVERRVERGHSIIALGGGMVGDLAGFVAATFLRGLPLIQVPTSLMAMVDAAIGGKVAVNHPKAKNLIGAFYQPRLVLADVATLTTLPRRELTSGWAEVVKHGLILDPQLFQILEESLPRLLSLEKEATIAAVARSAGVKARVVSQDEREAGLRMILNYGHTIGHALEAATDYQALLHGEAVALGMMGAALIGLRIGVTPEAVVARQRALLVGFGLPVTWSGGDLGRIMGAMELDKKVKEAEQRWVLLSGIGCTVIRDDVPLDVVRGALEELFKALN